ncbi:MAG: hypothetical protein JJ850_10285 [Kordiimonadaceae bacterium]|nr:hypothetical protein [Kordiimonadaceae bacterium]MBO6569522.1 hypothetical protein [Kordiimonadaceae bacterium]MBO6964997.1 hypothetical protein [Kordiimonadaceae bacterium]
MSKHHFQIGEANHADPKTIVILGVARGGTSMVAGAAREMGIDLGQHLGENHEDRRFLSKDLKDVRERIAVRNAEAETWGWKMPHSLEYIEQIEGELRNPHIVLVWRNTLASAISQVNRSDADIHTALRFSSNRLMEMVQKVKLLNSPTLLINYDAAIKDKEEFLTTYAEFMGVELTDDMRQRCLQFIDPSVGYQQVSSTFYQADYVGQVACSEPVKSHRVLRQVAENEETGQWTIEGKGPKIVFRVSKKHKLPEKFFLQVTNTHAEDQRCRLFFDFDWQFSPAMIKWLIIPHGTHVFEVTSNGQLIRAALEPSGEPEGPSHLQDAAIFHKADVPAEAENA